MRPIFRSFSRVVDAPEGGCLGLSPKGLDTLELSGEGVRILPSFWLKYHLTGLMNSVVPRLPDMGSSCGFIRTYQ